MAKAKGTTTNPSNSTTQTKAVDVSKTISASKERKITPPGAKNNNQSQTNKTTYKTSSPAKEAVKEPAVANLKRADDVDLKVVKQNKNVREVNNYEDVTLQAAESAKTVFQSATDVGKKLVNNLRTKNANQLIKEDTRDLTNKELSKVSRLQNLSDEKRQNLKNKVNSNKVFEKNLKQALKVDKSIAIKGKDLEGKTTQMNIGFDQKGKMFISTRKDRNIEVWRKASDKEISNISSKFNKVDKIDIIQNQKNGKNPSYVANNNIILNKLKRENPEIGKKFTDIKNLDYNKPNTSKGYISITDDSGKTNNYRILRANKNELILQQPYNRNSNPVILNVGKLKNERVNRNTISVSNLDQNTKLGFNTDTKRYMLGTKKGDSISWSSLKDGLLKIGEKDQGKAKSLEAKIKSGDYILSATVKPLSKNEKSFLVAQNNKGDLKISKNGGKNWRKPTMMEKAKIKAERSKEIAQNKKKDNAIGRAFKKLAI